MCEVSLGRLLRKRVVLDYEQPKSFSELTPLQFGCFLKIRNVNGAALQRRAALECRTYLRRVALGVNYGLLRHN